MDITELRTERIKQLITLAKTQGFLTHLEVVTHLPKNLLDPEHVPDIISMFKDMNIKVIDTSNNDY